MKNLTLRQRLCKSGFITMLGALFLSLVIVSSGFAVPLPGGTLDPLTIPKYVTPLVIPPVMNDAGTADGNTATPNKYNIAVRQFKQQILPGGIWNKLNGRADTFNPTPIWSYGPAGETKKLDLVAPNPNSQFNYPAYTIETSANAPVDVKWVNDLVDASGTPLKHLLGDVVDQTLHWANPGLTKCVDPSKTKDCTTNDPAPYTGPVPIVTHVHGAHVDPHSDGYPEAWWLPKGVDSLVSDMSGTLFTGGNDGKQGYADYSYRNDQPPTTLWYHDHTLGMTRLNVYAGPAGFWLVRGDNAALPENTVMRGDVDDGTTNGTIPSQNDGILPGPAPKTGDTVLELNAPSLVNGTTDKRRGIREIPIVIQDRSFNEDGSLFYPANRAFFEGLNVQGTDGTQEGQFPAGTGELQIPFVAESPPSSDIAPIWNPEAFFNVMVVNGVSWPQLEVAPALYRLRLLNGCNSRFLNLSLEVVNKNGKTNKELNIYQIGGDQGFLPQVVEIKTGKATPLPGDGLIPINRINPKFKDQALLMGLAERADVIVDFRGLKNGTVVRMVNTAPDAPFGGFPDIPADPATTGQVMQFVVNTALNGESGTDPVLADGVTPNDFAATDPYSLVMSGAEPANPIIVAPANARTLSLNEEESATLCVTVDATGNVTEDKTASPDLTVPGQCLVTGAPPGTVAASVPMAPKAALLGTFDATTGLRTPLTWSAPITERPVKGDTEQWDIYNLTVDGHPIHLHLVRYQVKDRQLLDPVTSLPVGIPMPPQANELGYKDTVIAYPGEVTRVVATFDIAGLYVWHCHIVEHEDNEMMRPYCVDEDANTNSCSELGPKVL